MPPSPWDKSLSPKAQWANGGGGLLSPTYQHGGYQKRRTRQGLVWCIIIITHSHKCTQIDMGRKNSVPENRDLQSLNCVTRTLCIFGGRWRTQRCEVEDSVCLGFGGGRLQFPIHASIDLSRYISYDDVEEFLICHKLSFFWPDINTH